MRQSSPVLGILGGLGPMATAYFYELLIAHTQVQCDQDHIDILINSHASTPDRTAFITGASDQDPLSVMVADLKRMETYGAELVAIPCNTAHYFFDKLNSLAERKSLIAEVRGAGLMIGVEFKEEISKQVTSAMRDRGYLVGSVGTKVLRIVPPLILKEADADGFTEALENVLQNI